MVLLCGLIMMENEDKVEARFFLFLNDCMVLFPKLKRNDFSLSKEERELMLRMEKLLYENLSIHEIEELLHFNA
jgi:hypothetical protein